MFISLNQFYVFLSCVAIGTVSGIFFSFSIFLKDLVKVKPIKPVFDVCAFILTFALYTVSSFMLCFPSLRAYMVVGVFLGIFLYMKSFNIILAKILKKAYNIIKRKKRDRCKNDGVKV